MVFLTSLIIVIILYYLQAEGLIFVTIVAVAAELINIFMTQTLSRSVEKKATDKFKIVENRYASQIAVLEKMIKELEDIQEKSVRKILKANLKIKEYEEQLGIIDPETNQDEGAQNEEENASNLENNAPNDGKKEKPEKFIDLPSGSNRKNLPI
ncbi:MAG: hypothetical protein GY699_22465 [Desulfobacteraceae bacterium]|nr:hypothetical protein [Desulfobacteraceae bacterium]